MKVWGMKTVTMGSGDSQMNGNQILNDSTELDRYMKTVHLGLCSVLEAADLKMIRDHP